MSCPPPLPAVLRGKCGFLKPWLWGQRSAGGKSADCVTAPRCGWRRPWLQSRCAQNAAWLAADAIHSILRRGFLFRDLYSFAIFKQHDRTEVEISPLIRYDAASTITAWNEEEEGWSLRVLFQCISAARDVLFVLTWLYLRCQEWWVSELETGVCVKCADHSFILDPPIPPPARVSALWQRQWRRVSRENTEGASKVLQSK